jgi:NAD(P)-dependent dehydrogenase (short-subunit alcohol dehydrogenase family)
VNKFAYSVSKLGVNSLKMSAAVDLAPFNIRVNAISIGPTGSPVGSKENPGRKRQYESNALAGHIGYLTMLLMQYHFWFLKRPDIYAAILPGNGGGAISR